jgi:hypothetical protein
MLSRDNDYVSMWIEEGVLFSDYKKKLIIDLDTAKKIVQDRLDFTEGKSYPIVIDFSNLKSADKAARDYMNDPQGGLKGILAGAFLSNNAVATLFINLYLRINKPSVPAKFFTDRREALEWLKTVMSEKSIL